MRKHTVACPYVVRASHRNVPLEDALQDVADRLSLGHHRTCCRNDENALSKHFVLGEDEDARSR